MFLSGEIRSWCVGAVSVERWRPGGSGADGAEVSRGHEPAGLWLLGRTERWELTGGAAVPVIVAMIATNPRGGADRCGGTKNPGGPSAVRSDDPAAAGDTVR